jgi:RNA recognition motif-containing protein
MSTHTSDVPIFLNFTTTITITMSQEEYNEEEAEPAMEEEEGYKIHISRVPTKFTEEIVQRILEDQFGANAVATVELILPRREEEEEQQQQEGGEQNDDADPQPEEKEKTHRGFGFVTFQTEQAQSHALKLQRIKGGQKATSIKLHTMYLRPYAENEEDHNVCYLWSQQRCPYGDECKFTHSGPGGCKPTFVVDDANRAKKKKGKCFLYKKGKCAKGDACPFSHDFDNSTKKEIKSVGVLLPKSEKDCINWKTKGKCRKGDKCPYRHDEQVQKLALKKLKKKIDKNDNQKEKQPLSVRVFGMNYESTEQDIRDFFSECGPIQDVTLPVFEDSGRSKGYCGVWFSSPKAVAEAVALDGQELMGRWLRIQAGKMYLKQWEEFHQPPAKRAKTSTEEAYAEE